VYAALVFSKLIFFFSLNHFMSSKQPSRRKDHEAHKLEEKINFSVHFSAN